MATREERRKRASQQNCGWHVKLDKRHPNQLKGWYVVRYGVVIDQFLTKKQAVELADKRRRAERVEKFNK